MEKKGFTLIELLVVIAILAGLVAILFPNFMEARARARDAQRKSDLKNIQKALELYRENHNPPSYPDDTVFNTDAIVCGTWADSGITYMAKFPGDPLGNCTTKRRYYYHNYSSGGDVRDTLKYDLYACLENKADSDIVAAPDTYYFDAFTGYTCSNNLFYKVSEP